MADIDKVRGNITLPGPEELAQEVTLPEEETQKGPIEINELEDGGVEIDFDPAAMVAEGGNDLIYKVNTKIINLHVMIGNKRTRKV